MNGQQARLPDLQAYLCQNPLDIIALQDTRVPAHECHILGYVDFHSKLQHADGKLRASLYMRWHLLQTAVELWILEVFALM